MTNQTSRDRSISGVMEKARSREYRVRTDDRPPEWWEHPDQEGLWDADLSLVEEEFEVHRGIGATNPRIEWREVPGVALSWFKTDEASKLMQWALGEWENELAPTERDSYGGQIGRFLLAVFADEGNYQ